MLNSCNQSAERVVEQTLRTTSHILDILHDGPTDDAYLAERREGPVAERQSVVERRPEALGDEQQFRRLVDVDRDSDEQASRTDELRDGPRHALQRVQLSCTRNTSISK